MIELKDRALQMGAAGIGVIISFFTGLPPVLLVLLGVMTLDYITGITTGLAGVSSKSSTGGVSSSAAFTGIIKKFLIIIVVMLSYLMDYVITKGTDITIAMISTGTCCWFIASEGISILENAAKIGVPIPGALRQALDLLRKKGESTTPPTAQKPPDIQAPEA